MIVDLVVKLLGGRWKVRMLSQTARPKVLRKLMRWIFARQMHGYGAWIGHTAQFVGEPCFPHKPYGVFVSGKAVVGRNCTIFQQVTIGSNGLKGSKRHGGPTLGENVFLGAGCKVIGRVTIGDNARIGANAVVARDVPANAIVTATSEMRVSENAELDNRFFVSRKGRTVYFDDGNWVEGEGREAG